MRRRRPALVLGVLLGLVGYGLLAQSAGGPVDAPADSPTWTSAERPLLERIYRDNRLVDEPHRTPPWAYAKVLSERVLRGVGDWLTDLLGGLSPRLASQMGWLLILLAAAVVLAVLALLAWRLFARRPPPRPRSAVAAPAEAVPAAHDREGWQRRLEERLAAGDPFGALEALWWWLGSCLAARDPDPAWTSGELVRRCGRSDLRPAVSHLDRLRFGPISPTVDQVRSLFQHLEGRLEARP